MEEDIQQIPKKQKNSHIWIIVIGLILVIIILSIFLFFQNNSGELSFKQSLTCEDLIDQNQKEECYNCENEINELKRDLCFEFLVTMTNEDFCEKISDQNKKDGCYKFIARQKKEESKCEKIMRQDTKDYCYMSLSLEKQNPNLCTNVIDKKRRGKCYEDGALWGDGDISICDKIDFYDDMKIRCKAKIKKDESLCNDIKDHSISGECYWHLALIKKDAGICELADDNIKDEKGMTDKEYCYVYIQGI